MTGLRRLRRIATALAGSLSHFLLPSECLLCSAGSRGALCAQCRDALPLASGNLARCPRCGLKLESAGAWTPATSAPLCGQCQSNPPAFDHTLIVTDYAPPIDALIQDLKFRARLPLARALGSLLADSAVGHAQRSGERPDFLLPVPLSRERLEGRGFNQAVELARPVADVLNRPMLLTACVRTRHTGAQAELPLSERRVNMRGAFAVCDRKLIENQHLLVIDDVMTTGHTLRELAACLKRHGAARVSNLVLARTPLH